MREGKTWDPDCPVRWQYRERIVVVISACLLTPIQDYEIGYFNVLMGIYKTNESLLHASQLYTKELLYMYNSQTYTRTVNAYRPVHTLNSIWNLTSPPKTPNIFLFNKSAIQPTTWTINHTHSFYHNIGFKLYSLSQCLFISISQQFQKSWCLLSQTVYSIKFEFFFL